MMENHTLIGFELKRFLIKTSFYSVEEYMDRDATYDIGVLLNCILIEMLHMILVFSNN